jgi:hypothetical protein
VPIIRVTGLRRAAAGAMGAVLGIATLLVPAGSAQASECRITGISPSRVVVGLSPVSRDWAVRTTGCTARDWYLAIDMATVRAFRGAAGESVHPSLLIEGSAGRTSADTFATSDSGARTQAQVPFTLLRRTSFGSSFDASPEPVRAGAAIRLTAKLSIVKWTIEEYIGYGERSVAVQFKPDGAPHYRTVKTVSSDHHGLVDTTVTTTRDGRFRLHYAGGSVAAGATSRSDRVELG